MATVTMSGKEYQEILRHQQDLEQKVAEMEEWVKRITCVKLDADTPWYSWGVGSMPPSREIKLPKWVQDLMVYHLVHQIIRMPQDTINRLYQEGVHYYTPMEPYLGTYGDIDLLNASDTLAECWEETQGLLQEKVKEEEADEA